MSEFYKNLGRNLVEARKAKGLTMSKVARAGDCDTHVIDAPVRVCTVGRKLRKLLRNE